MWLGASQLDNSNDCVCVPIEHVSFSMHLHK